MSAEFEVLALRYGTVRTTRGDLFYRHHAYGEGDGPIEMDFFFWLLRDGVQNVLVDSGFRPAVGLRRARTCLVEPVDALRRVGVEPGEISKIVVSHLHYDHVGNLASFPEATIVVQRRELDFWTGPQARHFQFAQVIEDDEIDYFAKAAAQGRLQVVDGDTELQPGLGLRLVGGHCPGQQIVLVEGPERPIVLASDALHLYEEMDKDRPFALFSDLAEMYRAYETLRELERGGAAVVAGHDPGVMQRFEPLGGSAAAFAVRIT